MAKRGRPPLGFQPLDTELPELLDLWNRALASPYGIRVASLRPNALAQKLYKARRECGHQAYANLVVTETEDSVWIQPKN